MIAWRDALAGVRLSRRRRHGAPLPERAHRHRVEPLAEGNHLGSKIEHDAAVETARALRGQETQAREVPRLDRGRRLDLYPDEPSGPILEQQVHLLPRVCAEVERARYDPARRQLSAMLVPTSSVVSPGVRSTSAR